MKVICVKNSLQVIHQQHAHYVQRKIDNNSLIADNQFLDIPLMLVVDNLHLDIFIANVLPFSDIQGEGGKTGGRGGMLLIGTDSH